MIVLPESAVGVIAAPMVAPFLGHQLPDGRDCLSRGGTRRGYVRQLLGVYVIHQPVGGQDQHVVRLEGKLIVLVREFSTQPYGAAELAWERARRYGGRELGQLSAAYEVCRAVAYGNSVQLVPELERRRYGGQKVASPSTLKEDLVCALDGVNQVTNTLDRSLLEDLRREPTGIGALALANSIEDDIQAGGTA